MKIVPTVVTRTLSREVLKAKKNSPHIFFVAGVAGVAASTYLACRATLKLEETTEVIKEDLESVKSLRDDSVRKGTTYHEQEYYKDLGYVYTKSTVSLVKLYGPSFALGVVSVAALTGSHIQLSRRNAALTFTLGAVSKALEDYRTRVQEELGEERELDIYHDVETRKVEVDGKKSVEKVVASTEFSPYARFFDEGSVNWEKDAELNYIFLQLQQNYANHLLNSRGHLFLNEVYDLLGIERSQAGAVVGWVLNGEGDDFVDFGIYDKRNANFVHGYERNILLDFNVDGVVYDKI